MPMRILMNNVCTITKQQLCRGVRVAPRQMPFESLQVRALSSCQPTEGIQTTREFSHSSKIQAQDKALDRFAKYQLNPQVLKAVVDFGKQPSEEAYHQSCQFIASEGAIRLAHMIAEFRELPDSHLANPHINNVHDWYTQSFGDIVGAKSSQDDFDAATSATAQKVLLRHSSVVIDMAKGIHNLRKTGAMKDEAGMNEFLDRFFMSRIAIRFLFNQHLQVFKEFIHNQGELPPDCDPNLRWVGSIDTNCNVAAVVGHAAESARMLCMEKYFDAPEIEIVEEISYEGLPVSITCIPSHLYHIMFELFKNSCRAVCEYHEIGPPPPICVTIVKGKTDVSIKISDRGGGIAHQTVQDIFSYHYSTAETPALLDNDNNDVQSMSDMNHAPLAGFGYGIPVSRLYARYFGGDLSISSLEGYGTDAYVHLRSNPLEAMEVLPSANEQEISYIKTLDRKTANNWRDHYN
eukprot:m.71448 g.71448  ORF g.71448 m.71448 type:complete len:462 (+) comp24350_c0_seq2:272-1657(+)